MMFLWKSLLRIREAGRTNGGFAQYLQRSKTKFL